MTCSAEAADAARTPYVNEEAEKANSQGLLVYQNIKEPHKAPPAAPTDGEVRKRTIRKKDQVKLDTAAAAAAAGATGSATNPFGEPVNFAGFNPNPAFDAAAAAPKAGNVAASSSIAGFEEEDAEIYDEPVDNENGNDSDFDV